MTNNGRSIDFRAREAGHIMNCVRAGRSSAIIGVDGIGKTSLLQHFMRKNVRDYYLKEHSEHTLFVLIDAHELINPSTLAYCRKMAFSLEPELKQRAIPLTEQNILTLDGLEVVQQVLFERVEALIQQHKRQSIVFILDAFEIALVEAEEHFLRVLRVLRERSDRRVHYIVSSTNEPALLPIENPSGHRKIMQMFEEIFNGNVWSLASFTERDARAMVERITSEHEQPPVHEKVYQLLLELTGAHAGLLKGATTAVVERRIVAGERDNIEGMTKRLLNDPSVYSKCEQLWNSFSEAEQDCLKGMHAGRVARRVLMNGGNIQQATIAIQALVFKGIWEEVEKEEYHCFSTLFAAYVSKRFGQIRRGLQLDFTHRQVWIDGAPIPKRLPPKEFLLLTCLAERPDQEFPRDELSLAVYGEIYQPDQDGGRLDALVERTRKHIDDNPRMPRFLETIRGVGHCLHEYIGPYT